MIQKILIAVAGLGKCEQMLKMLMEIPSIQRADVTILHVVSPQVTADLMAEKLTAGGKILADAIEYLKLEPAKVNVRLKQGDPKDTVCQVAEEENVDLIIMGSRGMSRLESILSNSVSQYVFQLTSRPMLLVNDDVNIKHINRIMVGYDNSIPAQQSLKLALFFLRDIKGSQLLLTQIKGDQKAADAMTNPEKDPVFMPAINEAKKQGVAYKCIVAGGNPGKELCKAAEEFHADLVMIGSPERRPSVARSLPDLDRLLGNSMSDYVRVKTPCPVLLTRSALG
ncbi:universal stress protein [Chamaesiphon sp. VAR_48_metabat_135_sub]|uniref:universal stress protein n=1 Tax=Chamaesiphon sp. VAR_48_metabat_135_sub TaxID=2964699 RepID=UPI00286BD557|nr:universal stress protein [Chamaesiphon sp. VAR_48_metabat_135_sub]